MGRFLYISRKERDWKMRSMWDYRVRKMEIAWELAGNLIRAKSESSGAWPEDEYITKAQQVLRQSYEAVNAVFRWDRDRD